MKGFEKVLLACGFVAFLAVPISTSVMAQSYNFPWSTTFNFPDIYSGSVSNATNYLFPTLSPGAITSDAQAASSSDYNLNYSGQSGTEYTQVQSAANYPGGAGGNGLRFWVGYDGSGNYNNNHSDPVDLFLGTSGNPGKQYPELWFCWYMRYQSGFQWAPANGPGGVSGGGPNYSKNIYIWSKTMSNPAVILEYANTDNYRMYVQLNRGGTSLYGNSGWQTVQCGGNANLTSDGSWHCFEAHIKADTNGSNGVGELWIDNVQQFSQSNVNFGTPRGWSMIEFNSNVSNPANSGVNYYIDYDDIAISTTGRIGSSAGGGEQHRRPHHRPRRGRPSLPTCRQPLSHRARSTSRGPPLRIAQGSWPTRFTGAARRWEPPPARPIRTRALLPIPPICTRYRRKMRRVTSRPNRPLYPQPPRMPLPDGEDDIGAGTYLLRNDIIMLPTEACAASLLTPRSSRAVSRNRSCPSPASASPS